MQVDLSLTKKYDRPGPRYTSYPTAPHFQPMDHDEWLQALRENEAIRGGSTSLYVHLPFCETLCLYCGCNVIITKRRELITEYLGYVEKEVGLFQQLVDSRRPVSQIHWGGGSPSYLAPDEIRFLGNVLHQQFEVSKDAEIAVEIDPRRLTRDHVVAFREAGFNRASLGVQDFDPEVQKAIYRIQPEEDTMRAVEWCRELGMGSLNIDLIYGLPLQTPASFHRSLEKVIALNPDRIAIFNFAYVPWMKPHQKAIDADAMPKPEMKMEMLKDIVETLTGAGYLYIGMDHFARPDDTLARAQAAGQLHRNFQGYTAGEWSDLFGFGLTSISGLDRVYAQNQKRLKEYYEALDRNQLPVSAGVTLNDDDYIRRSVIMQLMCNLQLSIPEVERRFDIEFREYFEGIDGRLLEFQEDGLAVVTEDEIRVTEKGRMFLRNIAMQFDRYLEQPIAMYSKTV